MSPAVAAAPLPTKSEIENWDTSYLDTAATNWRTAAAASEGAFDQHRRNIDSPGGTTWEGTAKDAALDRVTADVSVVGRHGGVLREAATLAENGAFDIKSAKDKAVEAITTAENDGFTVGEDLSVTDSRRYDITTIAERNKAAKELAEDIRWAAEQLGQADKLVGDRLQAKAADLEGIRFDGESDGRNGHVQLVDNETDGTDPNHPPTVGIPPDGSGPMSDAQIKSAVDEMLDGQDLSPAEAAQLADILRNDLQGAAGGGLSADDAYARAENAATTFMSKLHRPYIRKTTRLGVFADAERTPDGNILSDVTDTVIPAMRDAAGELIWVDEATGKQVPEGTPNSMTVPERGGFHLGHQFGSENWRILQQAAEEGWTQQELNDFVNHSEHFRVETPAENSGHANEDHSPFSRNPAWTPDRLVDGASGGAGGTSAPVISLPPNLPNVLDHPPVALPPFDGNHSPGPGLPPVAPTPPLPPWLTGAGGGEYTHNPLGGPIGVNVDAPPAPAPAAPSPGWSPPDISVHMPDVHITPEEAGKAGGFVAGVGAFLAILGKVGSTLAHPFG